MNLKTILVRRLVPKKTWGRIHNAGDGAYAYNFEPVYSERLDPNTVELIKQEDPVTLDEIRRKLRKHHGFGYGKFAVCLNHGGCSRASRFYGTNRKFGVERICTLDL